MPIKAGATVVQIMPMPVIGVVKERRFNDSHDQMEYLVESPDDGDADTDPQTRWFLESQIQEMASATVEVITPADVGDLAHVLGAGEQA